MNRIKQFDAEVKEIVRNANRAAMSEPKFIDASFCSDLVNDFYSSSWSDFRIMCGDLPIKQWINNNGFSRCKMSEATCYLIVGEKSEGGCWIIGKHKRYWLKPKT